MTTPNEIIETVCEFRGVLEAEVLSTKRTARVAQARQEAISLTKQFCKSYTISALCKLFGRDHTTIIYSILRVSDRERQAEYAGDMLAMRARIDPENYPNKQIIFRSVRAKQ